MKSTIEFISSVGSSLALSLGFHSLAERLDPISNHAAHAGKSNAALVQSSGACMPCYTEEISSGACMPCYTEEIASS